MDGTLTTAETWRGVHQWIRANYPSAAASRFITVRLPLVFLARTRLHELESTVAEGSENKLQQLRTALRDRAYQAAITTNLVTGFVVFGLRSSAVPLFVVEGLGETATIAGIGFLITAGLQALLLLPAGRMADTEGRRKALLWGTAGTAVGMLVLTGSDIAANGWGTPAVAATALFFAAMAIQGASGAFLGSAPAAVVGDIMGGRRGGIVVATFQMMADLGAIIGPLLAGLIIDLADFDWAFAVGAALALVAIIFVARMPETLHRSTPATGPSTRAREHDEPDAPTIGT
jgi:MFS family permease